MYTDNLGFKASNLILLPNDPALKFVRNYGGGQSFRSSDPIETQTGYEMKIADGLTQTILTTVKGKTLDDVFDAQMEYMMALVSTAKKLYKKGNLESEEFDQPDILGPILKVESQSSFEDLLKNQGLVNYNSGVRDIWDIRLQDQILPIDKENQYFGEGIRVVNLCYFNGTAIGCYYASDERTSLKAPREYVHKVLTGEN